MASTGPTTTGHALLGLLSIRSWTAYELTQQMRRALRWAWPRSEANLYNEIKRLVPQGFADSVEEDSGGRSRTRYEITPDGRAAVTDWLSTQPPSAPQVQFEALLRVFLADQGTPDDLRRTLAQTRGQVLEMMAEVGAIADEYASKRPPFPGRAHLNVLFIHFSVGFAEHLLAWCDDVEAELDTWGGRTADVGLTTGTRRMLDDARQRARSAMADHDRPEDGV